MGGFYRYFVNKNNRQLIEVPTASYLLYPIKIKNRQPAKTKENCL